MGKSRTKLRQRKSTLGAREQRAIAEGKVGRRLNPGGLVKSLQSLLDANRHPGNATVSVIADMRHLDIVPAEAKPLLDQILDKYPYKKRERIYPSR